MARPVTVKCPFCATLNRIDLEKLSLGPKCGHCHRPLHLDRPLKTGDEDFDRVIAGSSVPVLVDFYADWCGPCKMMAPTLDAFAAARQGEVLVLKLDTDANQATAGRFGIRGIPTLIAFKQGREAGRHVGVAQMGDLERLVG
ncbi:MAG TPA: thioredoxin [Gemmatimonadales bacterium]|nr:thioredoxin [Gemmatimonadales bacterium]